jgi:tryptase
MHNHHILALFAKALLLLGVGGSHASCGLGLSEQSNLNVFRHAARLSDLSTDIESRVRRSTVAVEINTRITASGEQFTSYCTGTLVATDRVLSAGHCFDEIFEFPSNELFSQVVSSRIVFGDHAANTPETKRRDIVSIVRQPLPESRRARIDVVALRFEGGVPDGYEPSSVNLDASLLASSGDRDFVVAGFGANLKDGAGFQGDGQWLRAGYLLYSEHPCLY